MKNRVFPLILLTIILTLSLGCSRRPLRPVYMKDGIEYGRVDGPFRQRWWNYYERGLSFAEGEFFTEALSDMNAAILQRYEDQRMARTYGMHFIDYFPHRERGIIFYEMGMLLEAKHELEFSLQHFPTAKARFYLDRVRERLIRKEGRAVSPPRLTLSIEQDEFWTRDDPVVISGVAKDENYISHITIGQIPLFLEYSGRRIPFKKELILPQGCHVISVWARNLMEESIERSVVIHVDREGPVITLEGLSFDGTELEISGSIYDEAGILSLMIDNTPFPLQNDLKTKGIDIPFVKRLITGKGEITLVALDQLGNRTSAAVPIPIQDDPLNQHSIPIPVDPLYVQNPLAGAAPIQVAFMDYTSDYPLFAFIFSDRDKAPPIIKLKGWTDKQTVFMERVYIEGHVSDDRNIEVLQINGTSILRRKGRHIFFSHMEDLEEGENLISIQAEDEAGNIARKRITIICRRPKAFILEERLSLTVFPFEEGEMASEAGVTFQNNLINALVKHGRFRVIERDVLDLILREQDLSRTELFDTDTCILLGRLSKAALLIAGNIIRTRRGIEIVSRMIDTETSEILATEDVYDEEKDLSHFMYLAEGMAMKIHRDFPLVDGIIIEKRQEDIFTDLRKDLIKNQRRLIIYREEKIRHPHTGIVLGTDNKIIGHARITQIMPQMSKARIVSPSPDLIRPSDKVVTE